MVAIFVIFTIVAFILVDALVQKSELKRQEAASGNKAAQRSSWNLPVTVKSLPGGIYSDSGHTWLSLNSDGTANVGDRCFCSIRRGHDGQTCAAKGGAEIPAW